MSNSGQTPGFERRRQERHRTDGLSCELGIVADLSKAGLRVACTGKPPVKVGQIQKLRLKAPGGRITVTGKVAWVRRTRFRKYDVGIQFMAVSPATVNALDQLAQFGFVGTRGARQWLPPGPATDEDRTDERRALRASIDLPDYYAILNVTPNATPAQIREAYRKLARVFHPDVNHDEEGQRRFIEINEAYEILKDPDRRVSYDVRKAG